MINRKPGILTLRTLPRRNNTPCSYCLTTLIDMPSNSKTTTAMPTTTNPLMMTLHPNSDEIGYQHVDLALPTMRLQ
jgi:hypothetical protein